MDGTKACEGAATISTHLGGTGAQECVFCGTKVSDDLVDHPFFGFAAQACDSVRSVSVCRKACRGAQTIDSNIGIEAAQECVHCGTKVRDDLVEHPLFGFSARGCSRDDSAT